MVEKSSVLSPDERQIALSVLERLRMPVFKSTARTGCEPCPMVVGMNCHGCGVRSLSRAGQQEQVNTTIDQILETFLKDAEKKEGVCPLWGIPRRCLLASQGRPVWLAVGLFAR